MPTPARTLCAADNAAAYPLLSSYTEQMDQLKAGLIAAITAAFDKRMSGPDAPAEPLMPLRCNAGQYGIHCVGGVMRNAGGQLVALWRGGGELTSLQKLSLEVLHNLLGQMERGEYAGATGARRKQAVGEEKVG